MRFLRGGGKQEEKEMFAFGEEITFPFFVDEPFVAAEDTLCIFKAFADLDNFPPPFSSSRAFFSADTLARVLAYD